jgi:hypothetical protein
MQSILDEPGADDVWRQLAPHLEAAMSRLGERDRTLLALRYYENKTGAEAAALLGIREEAARRRTNRALEKLRRFFFQRGVTSTTTAIAESIAANSVHVAPVALAKSVTAVALAKGATASVSTLTLIQGALKIMAWTKVKTAVVAGAVLILAAGTTTVMVRNSNHHSRVKTQWTPADKQIFDAETSRLVNDAKMAGLDCYMFADDHHNQWPGSFAQLKAANPKIRVSDANWEFVSGGNRNRYKDPSKTILFREKEARLSPDGKFLRIYTLADGSVQLVASPDEDFTASEKKFGFVAQK